MTAEPDLLPELVAEGLDFFNLAGDEGDKLYVRAIRQHIAAQAAEIEALRAEVERANGWNERVSVCRDHVADIVDGPCVICALDAAEARAERLAEALEEIRSRSTMNLAMHPDPSALTARLGDIYQIADAALSKGNSND